MDAQIRKMQYMCMVEYYSAINKDKILSFSTNMEEPGWQSVKRNKLGIEGQVPYDPTHM